jgi:hypothetical protein
VGREVPNSRASELCSDDSGHCGRREMVDEGKKRRRVVVLCYCWLGGVMSSIYSMEPGGTSVGSRES